MISNHDESVGDKVRSVRDVNLPLKLLGSKDASVTLGASSQLAFPASAELRL